MHHNGMRVLRSLIERHGLTQTMQSLGVDLTEPVKLPTYAVATAKSMLDTVPHATFSRTISRIR